VNAPLLKAEDYPAVQAGLMERIHHMIKDMNL
jgi:hypothetical protein